MDRTSKDEVIEQVRVGLLRMMEHNRGLTRAEICDRVGCSRRTLRGFIQREYWSLTLAQRISDAYPEAGEMPGRCPHCGRLPVMMSDD